MKKMTGHAFALWLIALIVTALLAAFIPFAHTETYWIAAGCTQLMFLVVLGVFFRSFRRADTLESRILGWPLFRTAVSALVFQLIVGFALMGFAGICPVWVAVLTEVVTLAICFAVLIVKDASREVMETAETQVRGATEKWKAIRQRAAQIAAETGSAEIRKLADDIRYADPTPTPMDDEVAKMLETLSSYATADNIEKAKRLLNQRNAAAKAGK